MATDNSRDFPQVGKRVSIEGIGETLFESMAQGQSHFITRDGQKIIRYSAENHLVRSAEEGYRIMGTYSTHELHPGMSGYSQSTEALRRARL